jgi:ADP-glucose pyrophosphorylase
LTLGKFRICNLTIENCHGSFIDSMMKTDSECANEYDIPYKPYALLKHISESTRFQQKLIKTQMDLVDPLVEPEMYKTLRSLAEYVLQLWIFSIESIQNYNGIDNECY